MSKSTFSNQLFLNDGSGHKMPIATGTWATQAVSMEEFRRISVTVGFQGSTGPTLFPLLPDPGFSGAANVLGGQGGIVGGAGGFTGVLQIQTTNERAYQDGATGTQGKGIGAQPCFDGSTGALYWQTIQSGTFNVTNSTKVAQIDVSDVGARWVRVTFNVNTSSLSTAAGSAGGSGTAHVFITAKNT